MMPLTSTYAMSYGYVIPGEQHWWREQPHCDAWRARIPHPQPRMRDATFNLSKRTPDSALLQPCEWLLQGRTAHHGHHVGVSLTNAWGIQHAIDISQWPPQGQSSDTFLEPLSLKSTWWPEKTA
jgi:hypothetical protein